MTSIEWTEKTWNPIAGCTVKSDGCQNCYALNMANRLQAMGLDKYQGLVRRSGKKSVWTGKINFDEKALLEPLKRQKPTRYFVNSMSDLFHENVPDDWIDRIFAVMALCPQHTFQVLTKRPERMREYYQNPARDDLITWAQAEFTNRFQSQTVSLPNVWLGVSIEDQKTANERIPLLLDTPAAVRWVSAEPLLGPVRLDRIGEWSETYEDLGRHPDDFWPPEAFDAMWLNALFGVYAGEARLPDGKPLGTIDVGLCVAGGGKLDWVVVGGESGPGARPMHPEWVRDIQWHCEAANVPFLFKQWGAWLDMSAEENGSALIRSASEIICHTAEKEVLGAGNRWGGMLASDWREKGGAYMGKVGKTKAGRELDGKTYDEYPEGAI